MGPQKVWTIGGLMDEFDEVCFDFDFDLMLLFLSTLTVQSGQV